MNSNRKHKSRKSKISSKLIKLKSSNDPLSFLTKEGTVLLSKAKNSNLYLTTVSNSNHLRISTSHMQLNHNKTQHTQANELVVKMKEEMCDLKEKNLKLMNENEDLKGKLSIAEKTIEERNMDQRNSIANKIMNDKRYDNLLFQSQNILEVVIDIVEILISQSKSINRDSIRVMNNNNNNTNSHNDNISFSIDVYEASIYNDDDRRICLLEQIQSLIQFKLKIFHDQFGLDIENMKARISEWNRNYIKDKENISNSVSFSNISQIKSKAQQNVVNANSISYSDHNTSSNLNVPLSPKFYGDEASDFCKSLNESEIKGLNEKEEDEQMNKYSFTDDPKSIRFSSPVKCIQLKENDQEPEIIKEVLTQFQQNANDFEHHSISNKGGEGEEEEEKIIHTFNNDNNSIIDNDKEEHKANNIWNNHIDISFENKFA